MKRKVIDVFLLIAGIVLLILALANFIVGLTSGAGVFPILVSLLSSLVTVALILRVLLLARDAGDGDKDIK